MITTQSEWLAFCLRDGWPRESIPELKALWKKYGFRNRVGAYVVRHGRYNIREFPTRAAAFKWAAWNYKGRRCYTVLSHDGPLAKTEAS